MRCVVSGGASLMKKPDILQIFDSRGNPTVEVDVHTAKGAQCASFNRNRVRSDRRCTTGA